MISKRINKLIIFFAITALLILPLASIFAPKQAMAEQDELTIYSWEEYMEVAEEDQSVENDLIYQFEQESGIKVNYVTFATNEDMYNELIKNPNSVDLICPSEYMIMKMRDEGLIKPYTAPNNWQLNGSPYIKQMFDKLGINTADGKTYAIGYMWGTMGFIYNTEHVVPEEMDNWKSIWETKYQGKVTIKDSVRDTYIMALGALYQEELLGLDKTALDYSEKVFEIFNRTDETTLNKVEQSLKELKGNIYGFEVDSGKNDIIDGKININFAWSGDAVCAIGEAPEGRLEYIVPKEGSNVWFDGWVMPNKADEEKALKFLEFISRQESAIRNMDYIGYSSCVAGDDIFNWLKESEEDGEYTINLGYFFGGSDSTYSITVENPHGYLATQYPDRTIIERCAIMDNFDVDTLSRINEMWTRVKFITFPMWTLILIAVLVVLSVALYFVYKFRSKIFKPKERNKKGYKVLKEEVL